MKSWSKKLEHTFTGRGSTRNFLFTQIKSTDKGFIYQINNNKLVHYEVFKNKDRYPSPSDFGKWAFCTTDLNRANFLLEQF